MFERFKKYSKWGEYFSWKEWEVKATVIGTVIAVIFFMFLNIYDEFTYFEEPLKNLLLYLIGGFLGLIGIVLSGIAIVASLFDEKQTKLIEKVNGKGTIERLMCSFEFLAFNLGIGIMYLIGLYLTICSRRPLANKGLYIIILGLTIYVILFNIFYTISLVGNCVSLTRVKTTYTDIIENEKNIYNVVNEVRIDFLVATLLQQHSVSKYQFMKELEEHIKSSNIPNKDNVIEYFQKYYGEDNSRRSS